MRIYEERVVALMLLLDADFQVHELPRDWSTAERDELLRLAMWAADEETLAWSDYGRAQDRGAAGTRECFKRAVEWEYRRSVFREALEVGAETEAGRADAGSGRPYYELMRRPRRPRSAA
jgi:hypothetical protein